MMLWSSDSKPVSLGLSGSATLHTVGRFAVAEEQTRRRWRS